LASAKQPASQIAIPADLKKFVENQISPSALIPEPRKLVQVVEPLPPPPPPVTTPIPVPVVQPIITPSPTPTPEVVYRSNGDTYVVGQCTWYVASKVNVPGNWGNANTWLANAQAEGWATGPNPRVGAIAWTAAGYYGHGALVVGVQGDQIDISEMNALNGPYNTDSQWVNASSYYYIYP
jgi:surface antigen